VKKTDKHRRYYRFTPVIHLEQAAYGGLDGLLEALAEEFGGSVGLVTQRQSQGTVLRYWHIAAAGAVRTAFRILPYLTIKRPQARLILCFAAASCQRPYAKARLTPGLKVHSSIASHIGSILNQGNIDKRHLQERTTQFLQFFAPQYLWISDYVFTDRIEQYLLRKGDHCFPYPNVNDFDQLGELLCAYYHDLFVAPDSRLDEQERRTFRSPWLPNPWV
jgi:hypothetical protein